MWNFRFIYQKYIKDFLGHFVDFHNAYNGLFAAKVGSVNYTLLEEGLKNRVSKCDFLITLDKNSRF